MMTGAHKHKIVHCFTRQKSRSHSNAVMLKQQFARTMGRAQTSDLSRKLYGTRTHGMMGREVTLWHLAEQMMADPGPMPRLTNTEDRLSSFNFE